jgi:hypothetical protein
MLHALFLVIMDVNLSKDPTEYEGSPPRKEAHLAVGSAVIGGIIGGVFFFFLFYVPTYFLDIRYANALIALGTVTGIGVGAATGPLISLRLSTLWGQRRLSGNTH